MFWKDLSSEAIGLLPRELPVVVPLGSCEQHGRHLPVFVDSFQLEEITRRIDQRLGDRALIAPVLWLGSSDHHRDFPGALSVTPGLFGHMVKSLAVSILDAGFSRIFFLNGHGGNLIPASQALSELILADERADAGHLTLASWWSVAAPKIQPHHHGMATPQLTHACEYETSLLLAIREDLVHLSRLDPDHKEEIRPWAADPRWQGKVDGFHRFHRWTTSGHMGSPESATREKGLSLLEAITEAIVEFLDDFRSWPDLPKIGRPSRPRCR